MKFFYLEKNTLLDYPGKVACTLFTYGCNFRCPFCHNPELVTDKWNQKKRSIDEDKILRFLKRRVNKLDAMVITGGEPLMWGDKLMCFLEKVKDLGFLVKVDTNGSFPKVLRKFNESAIIDYWAMDIKNSVEKYNNTAGINVDIKKMTKSIDLIMNSEVDYEFRTTVVPGFHDIEDIENIAKLIKGSDRFYIQNYRKGKTVSEDLNIEYGFTDKELENFKAVAEKYLKKVFIRNG